MDFLDHYMNQWFVTEEIFQDQDSDNQPIWGYKKRSLILDPVEAEVEDRKRYSWLEPRLFVSMLFEVLRAGESDYRLNGPDLLQQGDLFLWEGPDLGPKTPWARMSGLVPVDPFTDHICPLCEKYFQEYPDYLCRNCRFGGMAE